jgi:hypothetical protein
MLISEVIIWTTKADSLLSAKRRHSSTSAVNRTDMDLSITGFDFDESRPFILPR